ncbi:MAG: zinc ribbon domain-containing protein, partial [Clostridiales bacterium]|nr:zinc ribbon domain-containing protein [Clostridiales bacterium]
FKYLIVEKILQALYIFFTADMIILGFFMLFAAPKDFYGDRHWLGGYGIMIMILGPIVIRLVYELLMMAVLLLKNVISINNKLRNQNGGKEQDGVFAAPDMSALRQQLRSKAVRPQSPQNPSAPNFCSKCGSPLNEEGKCPNCDNRQDEA